MSTLLLVRHGQATPFDAETDRLSPLGVRQAEALARFWRSTGFDAGEVYTGTLERQRRTAAVVADQMAADGVPWPPAAADIGFDEYDGDGVFGTLATRLSASDPHMRELTEAAQAARGGPEQNRRFQHMAEYVADRWMRGAVTDPVVETWEQFCARIDDAVDRLLDAGSGRQVVVFTSGGVIGRTLQRVLQAPDATALALNWRVRNASVTQLTFGGRDRVSLDTFNVTAHLEPELSSFR